MFETDCIPQRFRLKVIKFIDDELGLDWDETECWDGKIAFTIFEPSGSEIRKLKKFVDNLVGNKVMGLFDGVSK